ncbi:hypothetical protein CR513_06847, partial [Mucuna pruriens]
MNLGRHEEHGKGTDYLETKVLQGFITRERLKRLEEEVSSSFQWKNYDLWAVKMEAYLEALDLWEAVKEDYEVLPLPDNPTMAQIKN